MKPLLPVKPLKPMEAMIHFLKIFFLCLNKLIIISKMTQYVSDFKSVAKIKPQSY